VPSRGFLAKPLSGGSESAQNAPPVFNHGFRRYLRPLRLINDSIQKCRGCPAILSFGARGLPKRFFRLHRQLFPRPLPQ
jgi:hypothetical protein